MVHRDHDAAAWHNVNVIATDKLSNASRPRASSVNNELAVDADLLVVLKVVGDHGGDLVSLANDLGDGSVGHDFGAVFDGGVGGAPHHLPAIDRTVLNGEGALNTGVQTRLATQGLRGGDFLEGNLGLLGSLNPLIRELQVIFWGHHEQAAGLLNGVSVDPGDDLIFLSAFRRRSGVRDDVSSTRVEQAVVTTGGSLAEVGLVQQDGAVSTHRDVPHDARTGGTATDDNDVCVHGPH